MDSITFEKKKLEQTKAKLEKKQKLISLKERKIRLKRILELGELIVKAGLEDLSSEILLGALLEVNQLKNKKEALKKWEENRHQWLENSTHSRLIISLKNIATDQQKLTLKNKKFRWNSFRQEWYGFGHKSEIELLLGKDNVEIEEVRN